MAEAAALLRDARRPLIVSGSGAIYAKATDHLQAFAAATGIPVAETQAGKGSRAVRQPQRRRAGCPQADRRAARRRRPPRTRGAPRRARRLGGGRRAHLSCPRARARVGRQGAARARPRPRPASGAERDHRPRQPRQRAARRGRVRRGQHARRPPQAVAHARSEGLPRRVRLLVHGLRGRRRPRDQVGRARPRGVRDGRRRLLSDDGPGDRHRRAGGREAHDRPGPEPWLRVDRRPQRGARLAALRTRCRARNARTGRLDGQTLPVELGLNAQSLGADVLYADTVDAFEEALRAARASDRRTVIHVQTDPLVPAPSSEAWWDVPVSEVAALESTRAARAVYDRHKRHQRTFLRTREKVETP